MGLPNFNSYEITEHAKNRYRERINGKATEEQILTGFRDHLSQANFMAKEPEGIEYWLHSEKRVVIILNTEDHKIISVYSYLKQSEDEKISELFDLKSKIKKLEKRVLEIHN